MLEHEPEDSAATHDHGDKEGGSFESEVMPLDPSTSHRRSYRGALAGLAVSLGAVGIGGITLYEVGVLPESPEVDRFLAKRGVGLNDSGEILVALHERFSELKELVAKKYGSSATVAPSEINLAVLCSEWIRYLEKHLEADPKPLEEAHRVYLEFLSEISDLALADPDFNEANGYEVRFAALKHAFDTNLSSAHYNREFDNLFDTLIGRENGAPRLQCLSGTKLFMLLARDLLGNPSSGRLVYVYTRGHILPGVLNHNNQILAVETTNIGGVMSFSLDDIPARIQLRVTDANRDDASSLLVEIQESEEDGIIIFSNVPRQNSLALNSPSGSGSRFGFGREDVPSGDLKRATTTVLSLDLYRRPLHVIQGETQQPAPSPAVTAEYGSQGEDNMRRTRLQKDAYIPVEMERVLSPDEISTVKRYLSFNEEVSEYYNRHVAVVNDKGIPYSEKAERLEKILNELEKYFEESGLSNLNDKVYAIMRSHGLAWGNTSTPANMFNTISHNQRVCKLRADKE